MAATDGGLGRSSALKSLGFWPSLFGAVFGAPSIISLIQAAFHTGDLHGLIQGIINSYNDGLRVAATLVEPHIQVVLIWLGSIFGWTIELHNHWRHLFILCLVPFLSIVRVQFLRERTGRTLGAFKRVMALPLIGALPFVLVGCLAAGTVPLNGGWLAQGLIVAIPVVSWVPAILVAMVMVTVVDRELRKGDQFVLMFLRDSPVLILLFGIVGFAAGAGLSLVPWVGDIAGISALGGLVVLLGINLVFSHDIAERDSGLTILGGFIIAGIVFGLDWLLSACC